MSSSFPSNAHGSAPAAKSVGREDRLRDVAHSTAHLDRIVPAVHVIDRHQLARAVFGDSRVTEIPASSVVAQHELAAPGSAVVLADAGAHAERRMAVTVDAGDSAVAHPDEVPGRAPVVDARDESPGAAAVIAPEDLRPQDAGRVALTADRGEDGAARKHDA